MEFFRRLTGRETKSNTPQVIEFVGEVEGIKGFSLRLELSDPYIQTLDPAAVKKIQGILRILGASITGILVSGEALEKSGSNVNRLLDIMEAKTSEGAKICRDVSKESGDS